ncbi:helix-turn-helix transcriptional regulator [bacterium]|nr:helix-turn-helix transcriptional regulator [bacterium]
MKDKICEILGENIKKYRKLRGYTQEKLAEAIELETRTLSLIETGNSFVSSKTIIKLSEVLQVSPSELLDSIDPDETQRLYEDAQKALEMIKSNPAKLRALNYILNGLL